VLCQLSYAPRLRRECSPEILEPCRTSRQSRRSRRDYAERVQRRLLGLLFALLALGLGLVAVYSALAGGRAWVVALAATVLALWMADLARRALLRRRA
jgi:hypothetical protein